MTLCGENAGEHFFANDLPTEDYKLENEKIFKRKKKKNYRIMKL